MNKFSLAASVLAVCLAFGGAGYAQCGSDDGFDTGCCTLPAPFLPSFPAITMIANWAELRGCTPTNLNTVTVALTPPSIVNCDYSLIGVNVLFASGETMVGTVAAKYARTWFELPSPPGGQTYRFLINGDFSVFPNAAATPCTSQLPRCAFIAGQQVHFDGHLDYRCVPGTILPTTVSMSLSHHQGCLTHASWSCLPLTGAAAHVESSWHLVGPAPFTFGTGVPAPAGPIIGDAVRTSLLQVVPAFNYQCISEIKMLPGGNIGPGAPSTCSCATTYACSGSAIPCPAAVACYEPTNLNFGTCCAAALNGPFNTLPLPGTPVAATGMLALRLGTWGPGPQYPAGTSLTVYWGVVNFTTAFGCVQPNWPVHATVGVATRNFLAQPFASSTSCAIPPPSTAFIDLENCLPLNSAFPNPGYGCLAASDVLWSFNTP